MKIEEHLIKGTGAHSLKGVEWSDVRALILRRRLQILVHSNLYYHKDHPLIEDHIYDKWGHELAQLQKDYPEIASRVDYHHYFKDYDGSTGMDLPYLFPEIDSVAQKLLRKKIVDKKSRVCYSKNVLNKNKKLKRGKRNGKKTKMD